MTFETPLIPHFEAALRADLSPGRVR